MAASRGNRRSRDGRLRSSRPGPSEMSLSVNGQTGIDPIFRAWVAEVAPKLCAPGHGRTWERFVALGEAAGRDLALGRLGEGHADAMAILGEAACAPVGDGPYGVWAARGATGEVKATPTGDGWRLDGRKGFC